MHGNRSGELRLFAGVIALTGTAGLLSGWLLPALLTGVLCYAAWHVYRVAALPDIVAGRRRPDTRFATGLWRDVLQALDNRDSDRQRREDELVRSLESFRGTVAALPDAVVILQADDRVFWTNTAARRLFGIPATDAAGQVFSTLVSDPLLGEYLSARSFVRPLTMSAPADRTKILSLQVIPEHADAGQRILVARDISRQHHLDEAQRDFIANVSHELRTPLTVLTGLLEQLESDIAGNDHARRITGIMQNQTARMRDLIADLLTLTQIETATLQPEHDTVDVPGLLKTILEEARTLAASSGQVLIPDIDAEYGLHGNAGELRTAFTNLVVNAIRHTPDRAEIRIRWSADETGARFSVSDTGEGIAARHIPRLSERFYRVDSSRSRDTGGTGLGLSIARQVLDHHDAELEITSKSGHGSTFTCHFPAMRTIRLATRP